MNEQLTNDQQPTTRSLEKAAQLWCLPTTEKLAMIPELAIEIARALDQAKYLIHIDYYT